MSVFGIIFWIWLVVSMVVFVRRRLRAREAVRSSGDGPSEAAAPAEPVHDRPAREGSGDDDPTSTGPESPGPEPRFEADLQAGASGTGLPDVSLAAGPSRPPNRPPDLTAALEGIRLPCDLAPLTVGVNTIDPDHVELVTSGVAPGQLVTELTAELERLGYDVADLGGGEHLARRDQTVVRVRMHDRPELAVAADDRGFPTAPPDGIVVELTLV